MPDIHNKSRVGEDRIISLQENLRKKRITGYGDLSSLRLMKYLLESSLFDYSIRHFLPLIAFVFRLYSLFCGFTKNNIGELKFLLKANRIYQTDSYIHAINNKVISAQNDLKYLVSNTASAGSAAGRTIVLKKPEWAGENINKGILLITFTETFGYYLRNIDIKRLARYFYIVLEPSWAGYADADILAWKHCDGQVFVEATEARDRELLSVINQNLFPIPIGASNWVNYRQFYPLAVDKIYDVLYVANYKLGKRVHAYLRAIRRLKLKGSEFRAALVCASWGSQREQVLGLARWYKLDDVLDIYESLGGEELNYIFNVSKSNILLSLKEGSNRVLFEGMFAGTPAILLENNIGVNKDFINEHTGMIIRESELADSILYFKEHWRSYDSRAWAMENITPEKSTELLVDAINNACTDAEILVNDVSVKVNQPEVCYLNSQPVDKSYTGNILHIFKEPGSKGVDIRNSLETGLIPSSKETRSS